jgi:uncharacterized OB-fold protein
VTPSATAHIFAHEMGQRCRDCGAFHYPPRTLCRICRGRHLAAEPLSGRGVVHALPPPAANVSTAVRHWVPVWVELAEGTLIRAELAAEEAIVGLPVELVPRQQRLRRARPAIGHAFRALEPAAQVFGIPRPIVPPAATRPARSSR